MLGFFVGVAVGAAFAPFWIKMYDAAVAKFHELMDKKRD